MITVLLTIVHVVVCFFLIVVILLQSGKAADLALFKLALLIRLTRSGTREALLQDYVKFAPPGLGY